MRPVVRALFVVVCIAAGGGARADDEADRLQLARELIILNQMLKNLDAMVPTMMNAMKPIITRGDAKVEKDYDAIMKLMLNEFEPFKAQMLDDFERVAARAYTKGELEEIVAFSKSPTGQKMARLAPTLAQAGMAIGQSYGEKVAAQLAEKMKAELRKRGHNI
ncbi:MAG TPA: DUF2059 domain-containing protein [Beijerinckiaceae bacterium]|nr:DUF2059 domain-containing protein [Beijerinckiaceae bacterium]